MKIKSLLILSVFALGLSSCGAVGPSSEDGTSTVSTVESTSKPDVSTTEAPTTETPTTETPTVEQDYAITVAASTLFDVSLSSDLAKAGEKVSVTFALKEGKKARLSQVLANAVEATKDSELVYSFVMPAEAVSVTFKEEQIFAITSVAIEGATITPSVSEAVAGEKVSISVVVTNASKSVESVKVNGTLASEGDTAGAYTFLMPSADAQIVVVLKDNSKAIAVKGDEHVSINVSNTTAIVGSEVALSLSLTSGFAIDTLVVKSGTNVIATTAKTILKHTFIMPNGDVEITATSKAAENTILSGETFKGTYLGEADDSGWGQAEYDVTIKFGKNDAVFTDDTDKEHIGIYEIVDKVVRFETINQEKKLYTFLISGENDAMKLTMQQNLTPYVTTSGSVFHKVIPYFGITNKGDTHVRILSISTGSAKAGTVVNFTLKFDDHYELDTLTVENSLGEKLATPVLNQTTKKYEFAMPKSDVVIKATSKHNGDLTYSISTTFDSTLFEVTGLEAKSYAGDVVKFTIKELSTSKVDLVTATAGGKDVAITLANGTYSFTMPASEITVNITAKAAVTSPFAAQVYTASMEVYDVYDGYSVIGETKATLTFSANGDKATLVIDSYAWDYEGNSFTDCDVQFTEATVSLVGSKTVNFNRVDSTKLKCVTSIDSAQINSRVVFTLKA